MPKERPPDNTVVTSFDWSTLQAAQGARIDALPAMINHALAVLADLLEETNHACEFSLETGPLINGNVAASVNDLLPDRCTVRALEPLPGWRTSVVDTLPDFFIPAWQTQAWAQGTPARILAVTLTDWAVALMNRLWPDDVDCWSLTVGTYDWYEAAYVDVVIDHQDRVWLLHLGVTD